MAKDAPRIGLTKKLLVSLFVTVLLLASLEGAASLLLAWRDAGDERGLSEEAHCDYDPLLGWVNKKNHRVPNLYGPNRHLTTNARGFRGKGTMGLQVPAGRYRIVCLGDSFTLGYGVDDDSTYPAWLERLEPTLQAVNMGQGGYGIDQSYLWYMRDGVELETDLLLLTFIAADFDRMMFNRFQGQYPKPVLTVAGDQLIVPDEPLPNDWERRRGKRRLGRFTDNLAIFECLWRWSWKEPYVKVEGQPFADVARRVVAELARTSKERGQDFVLVHLPLQDRGIGRPRELLAWLRPAADELGVPFLDLTEDFDALPKGEVDAYYAPDGHLNPLGNRLVASVLLKRLEALGVELPE